MFAFEIPTCMPKAIASLTGMPLLTAWAVASSVLFSFIFFISFLCLLVNLFLVADCEAVVAVAKLGAGEEGSEAGAGDGEGSVMVGAGEREGGEVSEVGAEEGGGMVGGGQLRSMFAGRVEGIGALSEGRGGGEGIGTLSEGGSCLVSALCPSPLLPDN